MTNKVHQTSYSGGLSPILNTANYNMDYYTTQLLEQKQFRTNEKLKTDMSVGTQNRKDAKIGECYKESVN